MGEPTVPTLAARNEAIELARKALEAIAADEESWFDDVSRILEIELPDTAQMLYVMLYMLVENADGTVDA